MSTKRTVIGVFESRTQAEQAVRDLHLGAIHVDKISMLYPDTLGGAPIVYEKSSKAPEGVIAGASTLGMVGGTLGLLAGVGLLAIPGIGPLVAAGPLFASLSAAAAGVAVGGIVGGLVGMGIPEVEATVYEARLKEGKALVMIDGLEPVDVIRAETILHDAGGEFVGERSAHAAE